MLLRLQVFLSRSGVCSRRQALVLIQSARVRVNGAVVTEPSFFVDEDTRAVSLDGKIVSLSSPVVILLNKPKGAVTTVQDRFAEKTVLELLPRRLRSVHPVGRLDKDTTGLLLLTNDGSLTHRLIHPSFEVEKVYQAFLDRDVDEKDRRVLEHGVMLEGRRTAPCRIRKVSMGLFEVTLHEGRKRQVRKMFALLGYRVKELSRIRQGFLTLGDLKPGEWRLLTQEEVKRLRKNGARPG
jgi:23S rRNA pseudouridine2605 synthase